MCSGQGNFEATLHVQHKQIFTKIGELITACEANFKTEEEKGSQTHPASNNS